MKTSQIFGVNTSTNTAKIHSRYNADHDVNPDPQAPRVTWAEELLAAEVDRLQRMIDRLIERVDQLERHAKQHTHA